MSFYDLDTDIFNQQFLPPRKRNTYFKAWGRVLLSSVQWIRDLFFTDYRISNSSDKVVKYSSTFPYLVDDLVYYETNGLIYTCILASTGNLPTNASFFTVKTFAVGDKIRYTNKSVYQCVDSTLSNEDGVVVISGYYFIKVQDSFLGVIERTKTNSQILAFEYHLNKWFYTSYNYPSINDIYITNNPNNNQSFLFGVDEDESSAIYLTDVEQEKYIADDLVQGASSFTINLPLVVYDSLNPSDPSGTTSTKDNIIRNFADRYVCSGVTYNIVTY